MSSMALPMLSHMLMWSLLLLLPAAAYVPRPHRHCHRETVTQSSMHDVLTSLAAGSVAGSIGVGLAYPFDSLKTRIQERASKQFITTENNPTSSTSNSNKVGMFEMMRIIFAEDGVRGFYNGVWGVMVGQAVIIGVAFTANSYSLEQIATIKGISVSEASITDLILASSIAGFITAFVVNPIERIKIILQTDNVGKYSGQLDCLLQVFHRDGFKGLMLTGIDATLLREIPGYAIYFVIYSLIIRQEMCAELFGSFAPAAAGAIAGVLSWIPIYPFDVVKTKLQNNMGDLVPPSKGSGASTSSSSEERNFSNTFSLLYRTYGASIFFDGIGSKLVRAAINHSADFYFYDLITKTVAAASS